MSIVFQRSRQEISDRLKTVDLVCTDLDECLYPFFTQVLVTARILVHAPLTPSLWIHLPRLMAGSLFVLVLIIITAGRVKWFGNRFLMQCFSWAMHGVPVRFLTHYAATLHTFFYKGSLRFLHLFADRGSRLAIISLSIQPILDAIHDHIGVPVESIGNRVTIAQGRFVGYAAEPMTGPDDKERCFDGVLARTGARVPLVIGHSADELPLAQRARAMGGVSIGINPRAHVRSAFDIVLEGICWDELNMVITELLT